jgi:FkbM family methyltransferase
MNTKKYSQGEEDAIIADFFGDFKGNLLSIGENDGRTFSNALRFVEMGWKATLVEPSPSTFEKLQELHKDNPKVTCIACAIGEENGLLTLHESGPHFKDRSDYSLLSTLKSSEKERWKGTVEFHEVEVPCLDWKTFQEKLGNVDFDYITIDAEGLDMAILQQINLEKVKLLCIEYNGDENAKLEILKYCNQYCMTKLLHINGENIILAQ